MDLLSAAKSIQNLKTFVEDGQLEQIVSLIASNEANAAKKCLSNLKYTKDKREIINRALTHLESAYEHFNTLILKKLDQFTLIRWDSFEKLIIDCLFVCCLRALCHKYLKDNKKMVVDALNDARELISIDYHSFGSDDAYADFVFTTAVFNPFAWKASLESERYENRLLGENFDFDKFFDYLSD